MYTIIGADGKEYGPASADQVRAWIAAGRANLDTKARAPGTEEWRSLGDFPEFGGSGAEPPFVGSSPHAAAAEPGTLAPRGARLGAFVIDGILSSLCLVPILAVAPWAMIVASSQNGDWASLLALPGLMAAGGLAGLASLALLVTQIALLSTRGQTLGKMACGVRIVRVDDGGPAGFVRAWLLRNFVVGIGYWIPYLGSLFLFVDACFIFRGDRRCLHDLIAGTKVVSARPPAAP